MSVRLSLGNVLEAEGLPPKSAHSAVRDLTLDNPEFVSRERRGLWARWGNGQGGKPLSA